MSAFVNLESTEDFALAKCHCPGTPHEHDTVTLRREYGYGDFAELARVELAGGKYDPMAGRAKLLQLAITGWSFVDADGKPVPVGLPMILLLKKEIVEPLVERVDTLYQESSPPVPNPSGGRSRHSSPESSTASPNRATRRAMKRSTSKS